MNEEWGNFALDRIPLHFVHFGNLLHQEKNTAPIQPVENEEEMFYLIFNEGLTKNELGDLYPFFQQGA